MEGIATAIAMMGVIWIPLLVILFFSNLPSVKKRRRERKEQISKGEKVSFFTSESFRFYIISFLQLIFVLILFAVTLPYLQRVIVGS